MNRLLKLWLVPVALAVAQPAAADFTMTFYDPCWGDAGCGSGDASPGTAPQYHGGGMVGTEAYHGDTVGGAGLFDILSMTAVVSGGYLNVSVVTRFLESQWTNIKYGDLMISTNGWNPTGTAPYDTDVATPAGGGGNQWNYVVRTSTQELLGITNDDLLKSQDVPQEGPSQFKTDQFVLYDGVTDNGTFAGNATVGIDSTYTIPDAIDGTQDDTGTRLDYSIALADLGIYDGDNIELGLRWAMTCANDIIEADVHIPEPASLSLLFGGLAGLGWFRKGRRRPQIS